MYSSLFSFIVGLVTVFYSFVFGFMIRNEVLHPIFSFVGNYPRGFILLGLGLIINQIYPSPAQVIDSRRYQVKVFFNVRIFKSNNLIPRLL